MQLSEAGSENKITRSAIKEKNGELRFLSVAARERILLQQKNGNSIYRDFYQFH